MEITATYTHFKSGDKVLFSPFPKKNGKVTIKSRSSESLISGTIIGIQYVGIKKNGYVVYTYTGKGYTGLCDQELQLE